jgi:hypothetical protein
MKLIGRNFSTWIDHSEGQIWVIKAMDLVPPKREPSLCFRDYLGFRLGARLGLAVPDTRLTHLEPYGRCSMHCFVEGAREVTDVQRQAVAASATGLKILLLDLLCRNRDRRHHNLLLAGGVYFPIDFNAAFCFANVGHEDSARIIMNWLGVGGARAVAARGREVLFRQVETARHLISERFLVYALSTIGEEFLCAAEREYLLHELIRRREDLPGYLDRWWQDTATRLENIPQEVTYEY